MSKGNWGVPIHIGIQRNEKKTCRICDDNRWRVSAMCRHHCQLNNYHGTPYGRKIDRREYRNEKAEVKTILSLNADHRGVMVALNWRWASTATVSKTREDLPAPDTPVNRVIFLLGISKEMPLRLFSWAPKILIVSCINFVRIVYEFFSRAAR